MNGFNKKLGKKTYSYRKASSMSTTTLAELSGTSQGNISKIEICGSLGVNLTDILPEENNLENEQIKYFNRLYIIAILNRISDNDLDIILTFLKKI